MVLSCDQVRRELSSYLDGDVPPQLGETVSAHVAECRRCAAILEGMRNVVRLAADERAFAPPAGFSERLERRLKEAAVGPRVLVRRAAEPGGRSALRTSLVWATAAGVLFATLSLLNAHNANAWRPKSWHSQPAISIPTGQVAICPEGKLFHEASCEYLRADSELVSGAVAVRLGYTPCTRCEGSLLKCKPSEEAAFHHSAVLVAALRPRDLR